MAKQRSEMRLFVAWDGSVLSSTRSVVEERCVVFFRSLICIHPKPPLTSQLLCPGLLSGS